MKPRDLSYLIDILEAARLAREFIGTTARKDFEHDAMRQAAVIRQLEVIGEATKRLSRETRDGHPHIPWRQMAGMRDILIHAYDHVDIDEVWNVVQAELPKLIHDIAALLAAAGE